MTDLALIVSMVNLILGVLVTMGSVFAFRYGFAHTAQEVQERVINALQTEINALKSRIDDLEKDNTRLTQTIGLIRALLKQRGLSVMIDGDVVNISDGSLASAARMTT